MAYLPQDLVLEVLSRLPVKSLLRFQCLSKLWHDLIQSPEFVDFHLQRWKTSTRIIQQIYSLSCCLPDVFFGLEFDPYKNSKAVGRNLYGPQRESFNMVGTCNGLICLVSDFDILERIVFWNPSTRKYRQGPLRIYPCKVCGFGYDQITKDYKFLMVTATLKEIFYKFYSLKSDSWGAERKLSGLYLCGRNSTFYNGAVCMIGIPNERDYDGKHWVVAFDLATEECRIVVALPDHDSWSWSFGGLSALGDSLYAISSPVEVWVMKSEGSRKSWNKLFHLRGEPLVYAEGGRKVLVHDLQDLEWCDIEKEGVEADCVYVTYEFYEHIYNNSRCIVATFTYCESLVSV